jgi:Glutamine amidotransferase domain
VRLTTDTDSEIALHLYENHGAEFVHHLRGEFAIVIADERRRCLIAARDRFGIKLLFYTEGGFLADCRYTRQANQTVFAGIRAVPPGCLLFAKDGSLDIRPYWDTVYPAKETFANDRRKVLLAAAETLEPDHPVAATILYRALLDDILNRARSPAYGRAARYLEKLDALAAHGDAASSIASHETYRASMSQKHGRKSGFWSLVKARS